MHGELRVEACPDGDVGEQRACCKLNFAEAFPGIDEGWSVGHRRAQMSMHGVLEQRHFQGTM